MLKTVSSISNVIGALNYKGTWNANSNVPVLSSGVGTKGDYYVVSTAGSTNLDGTTLWGVGDWAVFNGSIWQKVDGGDTSAVTSLTVTGLTGYMYANNTSPVTASTTIPVSNVAGAVSNTVYVIAGTGLSGGGPLTGNVTFNISNTTVTLGSYGSANTVPNYTINAQGQLTAASNTSIAIDAAAITTGTLAVARGGTNIASYTIGDLIYASGTTTLAKLADVAVGSVIVSGGTGAAPAYSATPSVTSLTASTSLTSPIHNSNTTLSLQTNGTTAAMTIDASQNVSIGTATVSAKLTVIGAAGALYASQSVASGYTSVFNAIVNAGTYYLMAFQAGGTTVGSITSNGTTTAYNVTSDYRLKENVLPMITGLTTINALKPVTYSWVRDKSSGEGFIAHELQEVIPHAVTGEKDAVDPDGLIRPQGVDYSKIVVHLVAAIKELSAKNDALEARLAALEGK